MLYPAILRKKQIYREYIRPANGRRPVPHNPGMSLFPLPDTGNVSEEVKRKQVEDPTKEHRI